MMKQELVMDHVGSHALKVPFKLVANDFLNFAKEDARENCLHGDVNAITNIKRCIENRLDSLLFLFGYYETAEKEKWAFPKKLSILEKLGIKAPRILHRKINLKRVLVEHRYEKPPEHVDIFDLIDISELFLEATDNFIRNSVFELAYFVKKDGITQAYLSIEFEAGKGKLKVEVFGGSDEPGHFGSLEEKFSLGIGDFDYPEWIRLYNKLGY